MKRIAILAAMAFVLSIVLGAVLWPAMVAADKPPGKLAFNLNIIGRPNDYNGNGADNGSRHTIFIPLKTDWYTDPCETEGGLNNPGATKIPVELPTKGVKLSIIPGSGFSVIDGDATGDKEATLQMPATKYNVYALAKGKPGGCLDLEAYTYDGEDWIFLGSVDVDRKNGKPVMVNLTNLLYAGNVALFADPYEGYFWQLYNNGLKLMNVRFYEQ